MMLALERALEPLDEARRAWFRLLFRSRLLGAVLAKREPRLALLVSLHALVAFSFALYFPVPVFVLAPIVLGVLHIAADVRYLVLRRSLPAWWVRTLAGFCAALLLLALLGREAPLLRNLRYELELGALFVAFAIYAAGRSGGSATRAGVASGIAAASAAAALRWPEAARLTLLHGHNLVAFALLFLVFPSARSRLWAPFSVLFALTLALGSGALYRVSLAAPGVSAFRIHLFEVSDWVAPGLRADIAVGLTTAYLFLQSAHYLIWLLLVPQREQRGEGTLTFRMTLRSLLHDFKAPGLALIAGLTLLILAGAAFDAPRTQRLYLSLGTFHAYLELAMLAYFWIRREARS